MIPFPTNIEGWKPRVGVNWASFSSRLRVRRWSPASPYQVRTPS